MVRAAPRTRSTDRSFTRLVGGVVLTDAQDDLQLLSAAYPNVHVSTI
jgi:hypothetical protein